MSRAPTNISASSNDAQVPWQYKWKRPRLAETKSLHQHKHTKQLQDKIPINTTCARLTKDEIGILLLHEHPDKESKRSAKRMKWEDLESESDEEEEKYNDTVHDEYMLSVTIFATVSVAKLLQSERSPGEQVIVPADTILVEVIRDSYRINDLEVLEDERVRDEIDVVMSEILFWPTSALVDTSSSSDLDGEGANEKPVQQDAINSEKAEIQKLQKDLLSGSIGKHIWKTIQDTLKLPKSLDDMNDEERLLHYDRLLRIQFKEAKRRVGVTSVALCRQRQRGSEQHLQIEDIMDVLDRMTLGIGLDVDPDLLATRIDNDAECDNHDYGVDELLLSCLCNDGKVQVFSILDLLQQEKDSTIERASPEDAFLSSFESLILGDVLKSTLEKTMLPLSKPKSTIDLSVMGIKGKVIPISDRVESHEQAEPDPQFVKIRELRQEINEYRPHLDLSVLDANIEPGTMHDRTMNNIPILCASAHEFIAVAGVGIRKRRQVRDLSARIGSDRPIWNDYTSPGGFISLISTRHLVETRTIFLPFPPKMIYPIEWNSTDLIIVLGQDEGECVAIRTDASSYVSANAEGSNGLGRSIAGSTSKQKHDFVKKFLPIPVSLSAESNGQELVGAFPVSVSIIPASSPSIVTCTFNGGDAVFQSFDLDCFQFVSRHDNMEWEGAVHMRPSPRMCISAKFRSKHFLGISPMSSAELPSCDLVSSSSSTAVRKRDLRCINGQGWMLMCVQIDDSMYLQYATFDGATETDGAYHQEITIFDHLDHQLTDNLLNFNFLGTVQMARSVSSANFKIKNGSPEEQIAVCTLRLDRSSTLALSMREKVVSSHLSSSYNDVISWLCSQQEYCTAAAIAIGLLHDNEGLADLDVVIISTCNDSHDASHRDEILESITPLDVHAHDNTSSSRRSRASESLSTAISQHDLRRQRIMVDLSNTAVSCLVHAGSKLSSVLDKFLGRNEYYNEIAACRTLVLNASSTIKNVGCDDMRHLAPYSYNPMESEDHSLWPIQCLLRVAVNRGCMDSALQMLNETIPDELRHRSIHVYEEDENSYRNTLKLSKSIISMIMASSKYAGRVLMGLREHSTDKLYWESLDDETRLSLSMLHVQGRYPLLREPEVRAWTLQLLHRSATLLTSDASADYEVVVPSDWLKEMCTGVLSNAGCDFSQTILFTPALSIEGVQSIGTDEKHMFKYLQEEEEDLYDYLTAAPGYGGIDFDIIIPAFLILEDRKMHWLGNDKVPSQTILNIVCDLAGRHSSEEPKFPFDSVAVMKQCVKMKNAEAAANLIGGHSGLVLKCAQILASESNITIQAAERLLRSDNNAPPSPKLPIRVYESSGEEVFALTEGHESLLWLLEKHTIRVKKFGAFYIEESRGQIDPVFAARACLHTWLHLMALYPTSGRWLEQWLQERLDRENTRNNTSNRLPSAAIIRALLWTEATPRVHQSMNETSVLAISFGFSLPFLVNLTQSPFGLLECIPPAEIPEEALASK
jgi:hypothetical protein